MRTYKGSWSARVKQDFEIEVDGDDTEAIRLIEEEMSPHNVVELMDFEYTIESIEEIE